MRFRKLPVEVEVVEQVEEQREVETPSGSIDADAGDVILSGVEGERYPIKPEIFAKSYVPAEAGDLDAFKFYEKQVPEGVQVIYNEDNTTGVEVSGVYVADRGDLDKEAWTRAVEFAREFSRALGLSEPPEFAGDV